MVTPRPGGVAGYAPKPPTDLDLIGRAALSDLTRDLRSTYLRAYTATALDASKAFDHLAIPDGTSPVDPVFAADAAGCRAVNRVLRWAVAFHLPGAVLLDWIDEPAVIDSQWLWGDRAVVIEWDYSYDFGDPEALTVWEVAQ